MTDFHSAEIVKTKAGRQYHIGLAPGEVGNYILMCGDLDRARKTAERFERVRVEKANREYRTYTGSWKGLELSVMATGMGPDNTEIAIVELCQIADRPTLVRIGSSGALKREIGLGDLIVSTGALRLENTSTYFVSEGYPAVAHHEVVLALLESCRRQRLVHHVGVTATAPGFYGAQGRDVPGFPPRFKDLDAELARMNVSNLEMEASALFTLATFRGLRAGAVCAAYANRPANKFIDAKMKEKAEDACIKAGMGAIEVLAQMDSARREAKVPHWTPSLGLRRA